MLRGIFGSGGGAAIGGGGTSSPSTIPRWTGPSTLGDSALVQPSGTTRMYAANNDASAYLHLYGGNDDTLPVLGTLNNINPVTATFGWGFFNRSTDGNLQLSRKASSTTWSQVVTFERATGNVGIGTASPGSRVSVRSNTTSAGATPIYTIQANRQNSDTAGFLIGMDGNLDAALAVNGDSRSIRFGKDVSATFTEWGRFDSAGNFGIGTASPVSGSKLYVAGNAVTASGTTTMTDGFFYIPAAAGAPTGVPTAIAGRVPMYYDTTNDQFYIRNGANWRKVTLT